MAIRKKVTHYGTEKYQSAHIYMSCVEPDSGMLFESSLFIKYISNFCEVNEHLVVHFNQDLTITSRGVVPGIQISILHPDISRPGLRPTSSLENLAIMLAQELMEEFHQPTSMVILNGASIDHVELVDESRL